MNLFRLILRLLALFVLTTCVAWWVFAGADRGWTKTYVTRSAVDEVTGISYDIREDRFVPGMDFLVAGCGLSFALVAASFLPLLWSKHKL